VVAPDLCKVEHLVAEEGLAGLPLPHHDHEAELIRCVLFEQLHAFSRHEAVVGVLGVAHELDELPLPVLQQGRQLDRIVDPEVALARLADRREGAGLEVGRLEEDSRVVELAWVGQKLPRSCACIV
jgi:hypothetical protein